MSSFFQKLFGSNRENNKQKNTPQSRKLQIESLECREMLSISPVDSGGPAKNVILMIGDGMGFNTAQYGFTNNKAAQDFFNEMFSVSLAVTTYSITSNTPTTVSNPAGYDPARFWNGTDSGRRSPASGQGVQTTDSAEAITAMVSGHKVTAGGLNWNAATGKPLVTITDIANERGMMTGAVSTVGASHATGGGTGAHNPSRGNLTQIFDEMIVNLDVVMGAGASNSYISSTTWNTLTSGNPIINGTSYEMLRSKADFEAYANGTKDWADSPKDKLVGIFNHSSSRYDAYKSGGGINAYNALPDLATLSLAALNVLNTSDEGFFVMLEGGGIDWAAHDLNNAGLLLEVKDFQSSVMAVHQWITDNDMWENTLLIVTADHETGDYSSTFQGRNGSHSNALVPLWAAGAGSDLFVDYVWGKDTRAATEWSSVVAGFSGWDGSYIDNINIFDVMLAAMDREEPTTGEVVAVTDLVVPPHVMPANIKGDHFVSKITFTAPVGCTTTLYSIDENLHIGAGKTYATLVAARAALEANPGTAAGWVAQTTTGAGSRSYDFAYQLPPKTGWVGAPHTILHFVCVTQAGSEIALSETSDLRIGILVDQGVQNTLNITNNGDGTLTIDWRDCPHAAMYTPIAEIVAQYKDASGVWKDCVMGEKTLNNGVVKPLPNPTPENPNQMHPDRPDTMPISVKVSTPFGVSGTVEFRLITFVRPASMAPGYSPANETEWLTVNWNVMFGEVVVESIPTYDRMALTGAKVEGSKLENQIGTWNNETSVTTQDTWLVKLRWNAITPPNPGDVITYKLYYRVSGGNYRDNPIDITPNVVDGKLEFDYRVAERGTDHIFVIVAYANGVPFLNSMNATTTSGHALIPTGTLNSAPNADLRVSVPSTATIALQASTISRNETACFDEATGTWRAQLRFIVTTTDRPVGTTVSYAIRYREYGTNEWSTETFNFTGRTRNTTDTISAGNGQYDALNFPVGHLKAGVRYEFEVVMTVSGVSKTAFFTTPDGQLNLYNHSDTLVFAATGNDVVGNRINVAWNAVGIANNGNPRDNPNFNGTGSDAFQQVYRYYVVDLMQGTNVIATKTVGDGKSVAPLNTFFNVTADGTYTVRVTAKCAGNTEKVNSRNFIVSEVPLIALPSLGALTVDLITEADYNAKTDTVTVTMRWDVSAMPAGTTYELMYRLSNEDGGDSKWRPFPMNYPGDTWVNDNNGWTKPEVAQSVIDNIIMEWDHVNGTVTIIGLPYAKGWTKSSHGTYPSQLLTYPQYFWVVAVPPAGYSVDMPVPGTAPGSAPRSGWSNRVGIFTAAPPQFTPETLITYSTMQLSASRVADSFLANQSGKWINSTSVTIRDTWDVKLRWNPITPPNPGDEITYKLFYRLSGTSYGANPENIAMDLNPTLVDGRWEVDFRVAEHASDHIFVIVAYANGVPFLNSMGMTTGQANLIPEGTFGSGVDTRVNVPITATITLSTSLSRNETHNYDPATNSWAAQLRLNATSTEHSAGTPVTYKIRYRNYGTSDPWSEEFTHSGVTGTQANFNFPFGHMMLGGRYDFEIVVTVMGSSRTIFWSQTDPNQLALYVNNNSLNFAASGNDVEGNTIHVAWDSVSRQNAGAGTAPPAGQQEAFMYYVVELMQGNTVIATKQVGDGSTNLSGDADARKMSFNVTVAGTYTVKITAKCRGNTDVVNQRDFVVSTIPLTPLAVPTAKVATWDDHSITVNWEAVPGAIGYKVQWRKSGESNYFQPGSNTDWVNVSDLITTGTSFTITEYKGTGGNSPAPTELSPLESGVQYRIQVIAIAEDSQYNSAWSGFIGPDGAGIVGGSNDSLYGTTRLEKPTLQVTATETGFVVGVTCNNTARTQNTLVGGENSSVLLGYEVQWKLPSENEWKTITAGGDGKYTITTSETVDIRARALTNLRTSGSWIVLDTEMANSDWVTAIGKIEETTPWNVITTLNDGGAALYDAILQAKNGDTIVFDSKLSGTLTLSDGELFIDKNLTIDANGATITIKADVASRVASVAYGSMVTLVGLTLTGGDISGDGGAISNAGVLTLVDCTITGNKARRGGGLTSSGTTFLKDTIISGNTSTSHGGGVYVQRGSLEMEGGEISGNTMVGIQYPGGVVSGGNGGGIYNNGVLKLTGVTISRNAAPLFAGGGLYNAGTATLVDCDVTHNEAHWGGGISNSSDGTLTIIGGSIWKNNADDGYGGIGNSGELKLYSVPVTENTAQRLGGGLGNNKGTVLRESTNISNNTSADGNDDVWTNPDGAITWYDNVVAPASLEYVPTALMFEITTPSEDQLLAKTLTFWEFAAVSTTGSPIQDWEIHWGDGSDVTEILGGPRSRVSVTHYFREAGTYTITIKTTDFDGVVNIVTIGIYTVKENRMTPEAAPGTPLVAAFALEGPEFSLPEGPIVVSFAAPWAALGENRFENYLADLTETMRRRHMLDLDQSGRKSERASFTELVWDGELFDDEWLDFSEQKSDDFWNTVFEEEGSHLILPG